MASGNGANDPVGLAWLQAAKALMAEHPGLDLVTALKRVDAAAAALPPAAVAVRPEPSSVREVPRFTQPQASAPLSSPKPKHSSAAPSSQKALLRIDSARSSCNLAELLGQPWAIDVQAFANLQAMHAQAGATGAGGTLPPSASYPQYQMAANKPGVAVLTVAGVLTPKASLLSAAFDCAVSDHLRQQVRTMAADPAVKAVLLDIDSPGGSVLGIPALAQAVAELAGAKPTVALCTGRLCSAAYWIGSAANAVYLSGSTDYVGSIGVIATHRHQAAQQGRVVTEVTAGKYKSAASAHAPLDAGGRAVLQAQVDEVYRVFVDAVSRHRQVSAAAVLTHMAEGRVFIGHQALRAGLADGIQSQQALLEQLHDNPKAFAQRRRATLPA